MLRTRVALQVTVLSLFLAPHAAAAQSGADPTPLRGDPPAPVAPDVIARDAAGHATVRAIKLAAPLRVDGRLDEEVYQREKPFGGFIQVAPKYGEPQT